MWQLWVRKEQAEVVKGLELSEAALRAQISEVVERMKAQLGEV